MLMSQIKGYKAFNDDRTNRYGMFFEEGKIYTVPGKASFGLKGNGFHFCKNIEDTFRYFDPERCVIASVIGLGDIAIGYDDYNEYYDMYSATSIKIEHFLSREEVLNNIVNKSEQSICRFLQTGFQLTEEEIKMIEMRAKPNNQVENYLDYYSRGNKDAFTLKKKL